MFYDVFKQLCDAKKVKPSVVAQAIGINKSSVTNWKKDGRTPRGEVLQRIADYFGVTVDYLLGAGPESEAAPAARRAISDDDIKFALFGDSPDISTEDLENVRRFAAFIKDSKKGRDK